ncbi:MAG TPA: hypothetical protein VH143_30420 [Kofleriaceae bacterium]|jgi:hypothetical protein|nr:hypothetical protein [Kofleriaceae bacterium]
MSTALLVRQAKHDPSVLEATRVRGRRVIKRGLTVLATAAVAAALFYALVGRVPDAIPWAIGTYAGVALGVGATFIAVGVRRLALAANARRVLEAGRLPVARLRV